MIQTFLWYFFPEKPAMVQCTQGPTALTYGTQSVGGVSTDGCSVSKNYEQITWAACTHTEPDNTNKYHMEVRSLIRNTKASYHIQPEAAVDAKKITIKQAGYYKIEFTALLKINRLVNRVEVFKKTSSACTTLIQLRGQDSVC